MEEVENVNNRIKAIVDKLFSGNISKFCREIGVKQPTMNTILGERQSKPSYEVLLAISNATALENVSIEWVISGKGEMMKFASADSSLVDNLKAEVNQLKGENRVLREQLGLGERKDASKSA